MVQTALNLLYEPNNWLLWMLSDRGHIRPLIVSTQHFIYSREDKLLSVHSACPQATALNTQVTQNRYIGVKKLILAGGMTDQAIIDTIMFVRATKL